MSDEILDDFRASWQQQPIEQLVVGRRLARWRLRNNAALVLELSATLVAMIYGIWFLVVALRSPDLFFGLSGLALLVACPLAMVRAAAARRAGLRWQDRTPEGTLSFALTRTVTIDRILTLQRWNCGALLLSCCRYRRLRGRRMD